jgi:hypothetical protein
VKGSSDMKKFKQFFVKKEVGVKRMKFKHTVKFMKKSFKVSYKLWNNYIFFINSFYEVLSSISKFLTKFLARLQNNYVCHDCNQVKQFNEKTLKITEEAKIFVCHECHVGVMTDAREIMHNAIFKS